MLDDVRDGGDGCQIKQEVGDGGTAKPKRAKQKEAKRADDGGFDKALKEAIDENRKEEDRMLAKKQNAIDIMEKLIADCSLIKEVIEKFLPPTKQNSSQRQDSYAEFLPEAFNHLFENDPWLALDFLQQFGVKIDVKNRKNSSLFESLINIIKSKFSSLLEKEIYHPYLLESEIFLSQLGKFAIDFKTKEIQNIITKLFDNDQADFLGQMLSNITKSSNNDNTYLSLLFINSVAYGREGLVKYLLDTDIRYKFDINQGLSGKNNALSFAFSALYSSQEQDLTIVNMLLEAGADPNIANEKGATPLMQACQLGNLDAVKLLIEKGATVEASNNDNKTAFFFTTNFDVAEFLIEQGANLFARDTQGRPAYYSLLLENPAHEVLKFLNQCNTDVNFGIIEPSETAECQITIEKDPVRLLTKDSSIKICEEIIKHLYPLNDKQYFIELKEGINAAFIENFIAEYQHRHRQ